jgi:hypothetical protein
MSVSVVGFAFLFNLINTYSDYPRERKALIPYVF